MQLHVALYRQVAFIWNTQCYLSRKAHYYRQGQVTLYHATPSHADTDGYCTALPSLALFARLRIGGQRHAPAALPPRKDTCTHCIGGWMSASADVNGAEKREFLSPPGFESWTVQTTASCYIDWTIQLTSNPSHDSARPPGSYRKYEVQNMWHSVGGLQWRNIHTKFRKDRSVGLKADRLYIKQEQ